MEIREIVKLKPGLGGLDPPMNFGILLGREKTSKDQLASIYTLSGELKIKWKSVKEGTGIIYEGSKKDEQAMKEALRRMARKERNSNILELAPKNMINELSPEELWRSVIEHLSSGRSGEGASHEQRIEGTHPVSLSPEEIGRIHYDPYFLDPKQVKAVGRVLARCDDMGEPYFVRSDKGKRPEYVPYTRQKIREVEDHIQSLGDLRSVFLQWEDPPEDEKRKKRKVPRLKVDQISEVDLKGKNREEMERILVWARSYLENGKWPGLSEGVFGLAGTPIRRIKRFDLEKFMEFFSMDLTRTKKGDLASNLVTLLLKMGRIDKREASQLVVSYKISSGAQKFRSFFPEHVDRQASGLPEDVRTSDEEGRIDLTRLETYTVDPVDAKDFDDALSIEIDDDRVVLFVHIADVSHYVRPHDLIDAEARLRGTSVYLPTGALPMLPPELSENLCSLKQDLKRLSVTTRIEFRKKDLEVVEWKHFPSVIKVDSNLDYGTVDRLIEEGKEPFNTLCSLAEGLEEKKDRLRLHTQERKVRFMEGDEIQVDIKSPTRATRMIETFMVIANECVSRYLEERSVPNAYRVHPLPDRNSVDRFNSAAGALGLDLAIEAEWNRDRKGKNSMPGSEDTLLNSLKEGGKLTLGALSSSDAGEDEEIEQEWACPDPDEMEKAVRAYNMVTSAIGSLEDIRTRYLMNLRMLTTMPRAFYSTTNIGHFGLGSMCYCHFTSPIRRYADIITHRALRYELSRDPVIEGVEWERPTEAMIDEILDQVNEMSEEADNWERQMVDVALATRMEMDPALRFATHQGTVISITPSSVYVQLDDGATEGRLSIRHLGNLLLTVDEMETKVVYVPPEDEKGQKDEIALLKLGDRVRCTVFATSIAEGKIELSMAENLGISQRAPDN
ncbi:MAG: ribonuclease R [Thermoplasmatota archaeon]